jgi:hypothetical protein
MRRRPATSPRSGTAAAEDAVTLTSWLAGWLAGCASNTAVVDWDSLRLRLRRRRRRAVTVMVAAFDANVRDVGTIALDGQVSR